VRVDSADLALTGASVTSYSFSDFSYDPQTKIAVWTLSAPLQKDRLLIDLDAGGIDPITAIDGNVLDGDWSNNADVFASGDGVPGGDFQFSLNLLPGDANGSSQVTTADYLQVKALNGKTTTTSGYIAKCDVNGSGVIDSTDWQYVLGKVGNSLP